MSIPALTRRRALAALGALAAGLTPAGCGNDRTTTAPPGTPTPTARRRLVTLDSATAGLAFLLGRRQVGAASLVPHDPLLAAIAAVRSEPLREVSAADGGLELERITGLRPDLIVGLERRDPSIDRVTRIATTHQVRRTANADADALALGRALDAVTGTERALAMLSRRQKRLRDRLRSVERPSLSLLSPGPDGATLHTLGPSTAGARAVGAAGLSRPTAQQRLRPDHNPLPAISMEDLGQHDADWVVLLTGRSADPSFLDEQPLWRRLSAVHSDRVLEVDVYRWATSGSLLDTWWVTDDLAAILLGEERSVPTTDTPAGHRRLCRYAETVRTT